jgi:hypothetical protein
MHRTNPSTISNRINNTSIKEFQYHISYCKGILPLTFILINDDTRSSDDLTCLASFICRF